MAGRLLKARPAAVFFVIHQFTGHDGEPRERVWGPYTESGAKTALDSEARWGGHGIYFIERAELPSFTRVPKEVGK